MSTLKRELRVALSRHAQPLWFRILKWIVILTLAYLFHSHPYFWPGAGILLILSLSLHFFYRYKTHSWTRPWGGWNDLPAGREIKPPPRS